MEMKNNIQQAIPPYNSNQKPLLMPEYGRMIQRMVQKAMEITDRDQRQQCARYIVSVMARMQSGNMERPDFAHRLWNHLARISGYQLDIDYPVDIVPEVEVNTHPAPMPYPMKRIRRRHYGYLTEQMLEYLRDNPDDEECDELSRRAANHMRQNLYAWNPDSMDEDIVRQDFHVYTQDKVQWPNNFNFAPLVDDEALMMANKKRKKKK